MSLDLANLDLSAAMRSIQRNTVEVGECLEWTRCCAGGKPQLRTMSGPKARITLNVRRIQWFVSRGNDAGRLLVTPKCGNHRCVNPEHLGTVTMKQNGKRLARNENKSMRQLAGQTRAARERGKLTMEIAQEIRASSENNIALGARLGVHHSTISNVRRGKTWRELSMFDQMRGAA